MPLLYRSGYQTHQIIMNYIFSLETDSKLSIQNKQFWNQNQLKKHTVIILQLMFVFDGFFNQ